MGGTEAYAIVEACNAEAPEAGWPSASSERLSTTSRTKKESESGC